MTLEPYDVVALGTPPPKPSLVPGDEVAVEIDGIGRLVNRIVAREQGESENSTVTVTSEQGTMRGPRIQWST
jgi:hypothetical protein